MAKSVNKAQKKQPVPLWLWVLGGLILLTAMTILVFSPPAAVNSTVLPREVSVAQAADLRKAGAFVLDVREPSEWQEVHVPDLTLIPLGTLAGRVNDVPKDRQVVVICRSGNRSAEGRDILLKAGFENVTSVAGGINEWKSEGYPTTSGP